MRHGKSDKDGRSEVVCGTVRDSQANSPPSQERCGANGDKEQTGISWGAIRKAIDLCESGGIKALKPKRRGCKKGASRTLTREQEKQVQKDICDKRPEQLKMDFALWTREAVLICIREHFGIEMPVRTVGEYLKRWGFTPQKPIKVAYGQKPEAVKKWLAEEYPVISARAKTEKAEIHWTDETAVMNTDVRGRSHSPRGITPTTRAVWGSRQRFSMISSVNNQGKCHWMIIDGVFNADRLTRLSTFTSKTPAVAGVLLVGLHYTAFRDAIREDSRQTTPSRGVTQRKKFAVEANVESRANRVYGKPRKGRSAKGVLGHGQPESPSLQAGEGMAGEERGANRGVLSPELQSGAEPGRKAECRLETRYHHERSETNEGWFAEENNRPHEHGESVARASEVLFPGQARSLCRRLTIIHCRSNRYGAYLVECLL